MDNDQKEQLSNISNPYCTGGGGPSFENYAQSVFVLFLLLQIRPFSYQPGPVNKIRLQARQAGYATDDMVVYIKNPKTERESKIICNIKSTIKIQKKNKVFAEVMHDAWRDFNDIKLFKKKEDVIVLITSPTSKDYADTFRLLELARHCENAREFSEKAEQVNFTSTKSHNRLAVFKENLAAVNKDIALSEEEIFEFLKHFHICCFDFGIKNSINLGLLCTIISLHTREDPMNFFAALLQETARFNQNAGTMTLETISQNLRDKVIAFPSDYNGFVLDNKIGKLPVTEEVGTIYKKYSHEIIMFVFIGSWNMTNENDKSIVSNILNCSKSSWEKKLGKILEENSRFFELENNVVRILHKTELLKRVKAVVFSDDFKRFESNALTVLSQKDMTFDDRINSDFSQLLDSQKNKYSLDLKQNIAETLAMVSNNKNLLHKSSIDHASITIREVIRTLLGNADWLRWASLSSQLPLLAEADPNIFLTIIENNLKDNKEIFVELMSEEKNSYFLHSSYISGVLYALEALAWEEEFFVRTTLALSRLASLDPGGRWENRPINSLKSILLPGAPQTLASISKYKRALEKIKEYEPGVAWKILFGFLSGKPSFYLPSRKPIYRLTDKNELKFFLDEKIYSEIISYCSDLIADMAKEDIAKLYELIRYFDRIPSKNFQSLLDYMFSDKITLKTEEERTKLWCCLNEILEKWACFSNSALDAASIEKIQNLADKLRPNNPIYLHQKLFDAHSVRLITESGNYEEKRKSWEIKRKQALSEILEYGGVKAVEAFYESIESPHIVGITLGSLSNKNIEENVLPDFLASNIGAKTKFAQAFIWQRYCEQGDSWLNTIKVTDWSSQQIAEFFASLPLNSEICKKAEDLLGKSENEYWKIVDVSRYITNQKNLKAARKLLRYNRPKAAITVLAREYREAKIFNVNLAIKVLLSAFTSCEQADIMEQLDTLEIIKALQERKEIKKSDILNIEILYLDILDDESSTTSKHLQNQIASDPVFFCEIIKNIYKSENDASNNHKDISLSKQAIATKFYQILNRWKVVPGTQPDGTFSEQKFLEWYKLVTQISGKSGHLKHARRRLGKVLLHCPSDPSGFWINKKVAEILDNPNSSDMREELGIAYQNSHGAYFVDSTEEADIAIAAQYKEKAKITEEVGYEYIALMFRDIAKSYEDQAHRTKE